MEKELELHLIKGFIKRRKKVLIFTFLIAVMVGITIALALPPIYTSEAMISIEDQQIPEKIVQPTIEEYAEERIQKISQLILSRAKLLEIIDELELYPDIRDKKSPTELTKKMRKAIKLIPMAATMKGRSGQTLVVTVAFRLAFGDKDPVKAQKVAETVSQLYLEEDLKKRAKLVGGTAEFLRNELQRLNIEISNQEKLISEFKQNHPRELPIDRGYNLQAIARLERAFDQADMRLQLLQERKVLLQAKLGEVEPLTPIVIDGEDLALNPAERLKRLRLELASMQSVYSEKHPDLKKKKNEIAKLEKEVKESDDSVEKIKKLKQLEVKLASAESRSGPKHPDVKAIQKEIAILRKQVGNLVTEGAKIKISEEKPDNPFYINLKTQIETIDMEIKALEEDKLELISQMDEYQKRIDITPKVEEELNALTRDYDTLKRKYAEISNKLMNTELVQEMEGQEIGTRFSITSPAYLPTEPNEPNRLIIIVLSFILSIGISAGFAAFREYIDDSIRTSDQLKQLTNVPVLSAIAYIETEEEKQSRRARKWIWTFATISCVGLTLLFVNLFVVKLNYALRVLIERVKMIA